MCTPCKYRVHNGSTIFRPDRKSIHSRFERRIGFFSRGATDRLERLRGERGAEGEGEERDTGQSRSSRIDVIALGRNRALYTSGEIYEMIASRRRSSSASRYMRLIADEMRYLEVTMTRRKLTVVDPRGS